MTLRLATGPVCWGVGFAGAPENPPWADVLDGARDAGYRGLELGPFGYLPTDPRQLAEELAARDLEAVASFVLAPLHDPLQLPEITRVGRAVAALVAAVGGRHLIGTDLVTPERARTAGRSADAPRLGAEGRHALAKAIRVLDRIAGDAGLGFVLHPHAGSFIEFDDEIEWAAQQAALCLDTGHLAYAGLDPGGELLRYGDRVALLHLKDVDGAVLRGVLERRAGFSDAVAAGVFCPLGQGIVDLRAVLDVADRQEWATVEQDRRGPGGDPVADLMASRAVLEGAGIA